MHSIQQCLTLPVVLSLPCRRRGKNENEEKRELIFKEDGQEYAQVLRMLGNGRLEAQCIDGIKRLCHIRGKMRKKVWVNQGDIILVGLRDYQDAKGDVILKYMADEARSLKQYGELPENIRVNDTDAMMEGEENENAEYVADLGEGVPGWQPQLCRLLMGSCQQPAWNSYAFLFNVDQDKQSSAAWQACLAAAAQQHLHGWHDCSITMCRLSVMLPRVCLLCCLGFVCPAMLLCCLSSNVVVVKACN